MKLKNWYRKLLSRLLTMLGFGSSLGLMGCPAMYAPAPPDYSIKVHPEHLTFESNDTAPKIVWVITDGEWIIKEVTPFMTVTPHSGYGYNNSTITVRADKNNTGADRQGLIMVQSAVEPQYTATVKIFQSEKY